MTECFAGRVLLPAQGPAALKASVVVEIRDVSLADAPAPLVARQMIPDVELRPGGSIPFALIAPAAPAGRSYAYQAYVTLGDEASPSLLTTESIAAVPGDVSVPVKAAR